MFSLERYFYHAGSEMDHQDWKQLLASGAKRKYENQGTGYDVDKRLGSLRLKGSRNFNIHSRLLTRYLRG